MAGGAVNAHAAAASPLHASIAAQAASPTTADGTAQEQPGSSAGSSPLTGPAIGTAAGAGIAGSTLGVLRAARGRWNSPFTIGGAVLAGVIGGALGGWALQKALTDDGASGGGGETDLSEPDGPGLSPDPITATFAQFNVENLFDDQDGYGSDPIRTPEEYATGVEKVARTIATELDMPDVVALQEVENEAVAQAIAGHELLSDGKYTPVLLEGSDPRGIDVALLVRSDKFEVVEAYQDNLIDGRKRLFTRPPLVVRLTAVGDAADGAEQIAGGSRRSSDVNVMVLHLVSKLGGAKGDARRLDQAQFAADLATRIRTDDPDTPLIVAGDLNSAEGEPAWSALAQAVGGAQLLDPVIGQIADDDRYTYVYRGTPSMLDHIFVTPDIDVTSAEIKHINTSATEAERNDSSTARGASDHDPLMVTIELDAPKPSPTPSPPPDPAAAVD